MTRLMEQAIERLRAVPEPRQDQLARFLFNELEADERWSRSTCEHEDEVNRLIDSIESNAALPPAQTAE